MVEEKCAGKPPNRKEFNVFKGLDEGWCDSKFAKTQDWRSRKAKSGEGFTQHWGWALYPMSHRKWSKISN